MKLWILICLVALLLSPAALAHDGHSSSPPIRPDQADEAMEERAAILAHLSHYHEVPSRKTLEAASDQARQILFEIAGDEEAFLMHRHRALYALAAWSDDGVFQFLRSLLVDEDTEDGLRHHLLPILANGFGEAALNDLASFLHDDDPQIRISAAGAIATIDGDDAHQTLLTALKSEKHPLVRTRLQRYVTHIQ